MKRIALKSKKPLFFPPSCRNVDVEMDIELIQNNPKSETYTLKIVDRAYKDFEIGDGKIRKQVGRDIVRGLDKEYSYEMLNQLAQHLNIPFDDESVTTKNINDLFRQGFLVITNQECQAGEGMYGSEVGDWEIITE